MTLSESINMYSRLMPRSEKLYLAAIVFFMLISVGLEAFSVGAIFPLMAFVIDPSGHSIHQPAMSRAISFGNHVFGNHLLIAMALGFLVIFIVKNLFLYFFISFQNTSIGRNLVSGQVQLYSRYLRAPYFHHLNSNTADLIRNVTYEVGIIFNNVLRTVLAIAVDVVMVVAITVLLLFIAPRTTLGVFISLGVVAAFFNWALKKRLVRYGSVRQESTSLMIRWINQGLGGIKEIKVLGRESYFINRFEDAARKYVYVESNFNSLSQIPRLFFEVLALAGLLALIVTFSLVNKSGQNTIPMLAMFSLAGMRLTPAFNRIMSNSASLRYYLPGLNLVYEEFKRSDRFMELQMCFSNHRSPSQGGLQLEKVSFRYPSSEKSAIHQVTLSMEPTEIIGIVGESGAGKTTLINVILGLIEPIEGSIFINDGGREDAVGKNENFAGYVPQDIYLSDDTIKNNVAYGLTEQEIDEQKVWRALKLAHLDDFVASSPKGLDSWVGERGVRISGGQKQRIGLARALYSDPKLLILDEPTSALDAETEKEIAASIEEISSTKMVIIVTHRTGLLKLCHRVYKMHNGELEQMREHSPQPLEDFLQGKTKFSM